MAIKFIQSKKGAMVAPFLLNNPLNRKLTNILGDANSIITGIQQGTELRLGFAAERLLPVVTRQMN
jgi:hypothetical protein